MSEWDEYTLLDVIVVVFVQFTISLILILLFLFATTILLDLDPNYSKPGLEWEKKEK